MAFVRRKVTEEDIEFLGQYNIKSVYGSHSVKFIKELVVNNENDFYLFYIHSSGYKSQGLLICLGFIWKKNIWNVRCV